MFKKILIVDDDKDIRDFCRRFFNDQGFTALTAPDGKEALKIVENEEGLIVLLDLVMPVMDGIEALRRIKEIRPATVVVMVTAVEDIEKIKEAKRLGASGYITKPLHLDDLIRFVRDSVSRMDNDK
jgi:DNA-binding response OmpR family regulator